MTQAANLGALGTNAGTTGILPAAGGGTGTASGVTGFKNRIINGQMVLDQRNAGASVTPNNTYTLDRWFGLNSQTSKFTVQQSSVVPVGFFDSALITSSSAYSVGSGDYFVFAQRIEDFNVADLNWGTANAKTVTLSFWVRSSLTGTFGGSLRNGSGNRSYPFTYTISAANTWEYETITIAGDTTGTWTTGSNGIGIEVDFGLGAGSSFSGTAGAWASANYVSATGATSVVGTNGATWYITGVQLEVGSTATSFDYRPYGTEFSLCQRYFAKILAGASYSGFGNGLFASATGGAFIIKAPVTLRTSPTISILNLAAYDGASILPITLSTTYAAVDIFNQDFNVASGGTIHRPVNIVANGTTNAFLAFSSEL